MRVVAGKYKKQRLSSLKKSVALRATSDKVKGAVFNIIGSEIEGSRVLELFAGSGSVGIEAISRGADLVYFVENNRNNLQILKENINKLKIEEKFYKIIFTNTYKFLVNFSEDIFFDILFLDPPYNKKHIQKTFTLLNEFKYMSDNALIIAETSVEEKTDSLSGFELVKRKRYGDTFLHFFNKL